MGNRLLTLALNNLAAKYSTESKLKRISQVVLAAPDLDQDVFKNNLLPKLRNIGLRRTLYSSDKDKALNFSETCDAPCGLGAPGTRCSSLKN